MHRIAQQNTNLPILGLRFVTKWRIHTKWLQIIFRIFRFEDHCQDCVAYQVLTLLKCFISFSVPFSLISIFFPSPQSDGRHQGELVATGFTLLVSCEFSDKVGKPLVANRFFLVGLVNPTLLPSLCQS